MSTINIDQSEDFVAFTIDGQSVEFDLDEAGLRLAEIDRRHKDDMIECLDCGGKFTATANQTKVTCPGCQSENYLVDQSFLDDVAAYVRSKGVARCGRRAASAVYQAIVETLGRLKKNTTPTPASDSGTESTAPAGQAAGGGLS